MSKEHRQRQILNRLHEIGQVHVDKLAEIFDTSKDTIRRDLDEMESKCLLIDGGTTNTIFASLIPRSMPLRIVTNSFLVADALRGHPLAEIFFLGGRYNVESQTTVGETVFWQIENYHFDQCFLGVYAVDSEFGFSSPHPYEDENSIKKFLVKHSEEVIFMAARSKLDKKSNYIICNLSDAKYIVCEDSVSEETRKRYDNKIY